MRGHNICAKYRNAMSNILALCIVTSISVETALWRHSSDFSIREFCGTVYAIHRLLPREVKQLSLMFDMLYLRAPTQPLLLITWTWVVQVVLVLVQQQCCVAWLTALARS